MKRLITLACLFAQGCAPDSSTSGRALYNDKCAACHGTTGRGDGDLAQRLDTLPADLTRIAARRDGVWPMLEVMSIVDGYSTRYMPGSTMPIYDDFLRGDLVTFDTGNGTTQKTPASLLAITRYLETLQNPKPTHRVP